MIATAPSRPRWERWSAVATAGLLAACAAENARVTDPAPTPVADALTPQLIACSEATGYDPDGAAAMALGAFELGAGERQWRDCAYRAATEVVRPTLIQPAALDAIVQMDRQLTAAIEAGRATRAERKETVDAMMAALQESEASLRSAVQPGESPADALRSDPALDRLREELSILNRLIR